MLSRMEMIWWVSALGKNRSKSIKASQVPYLGLNGFKPELEHFAVRGFARGGHFRLCLREGQLESGLPRLPRLILG